MSSTGTASSWHWRVSRRTRPCPRPLPAEPQCLGSHYLDKYICPLDQPTGPASSSLPSRDAITALITLRCPWDNGWAGIMNTQTSVSIHSSTKYQALQKEQHELGHIMTQVQGCPSRDHCGWSKVQWCFQ